MSDPLERLHAADPARGLADLDPAAWASLHDAVLRTAPGPAPARRRRWRLGRNATIALGLGVALTAGGLATIPGFLGGTDGANCLRTWGEDAEVSGPWVTGDPVPDCELYWQQAGVEPPSDLVAFQVQGMTFVAPADQVPQGAVSLDGQPVYTPAEMELQLSVSDSVDGGVVCRSVDDSAAWAQSELDRLGLATTWEVEVTGDPEDPYWSRDGIDRPCSVINAQEHGRIEVFPGADPAVDVFPDGNPRADLLRERITDACVTVDEARAIADELLAGEHHWPTSSVVDETAACARVDLAIGGSIQVTVYGPTEVAAGGPGDQGRRVTGG